MSAQENNGTIRLAGVVRESIVDGPGIRFTVFVQGCPHHCPGCHNPQTHDPEGGYDCAPQRLLEEIDRDPLVRGVTLSGGEPMEQAEALLPFAREVRARGPGSCDFSGYTFEQLLEMGTRRPAVRELLSLAFLLVDGRFVLAERDLTLSFPGKPQSALAGPCCLACGGPGHRSECMKNAFPEGESGSR